MAWFQVVSWLYLVIVSWFYGNFLIYFMKGYWFLTHNQLFKYRFQFDEVKKHEAKIDKVSQV